MLINNVNYLKKHFPQIYEQILEVEKDIENGESKLKVVEAKKGKNTLLASIQGKEVFIHSKYDPLREADAILFRYKNVQQTSHLVFYGNGLGYHLREIVENNPGIKVSIYEPVPEAFYYFLCEFDLSTLKNNTLMNIYLENKDPQKAREEIKSLGNDLTSYNIQSIDFITLPSYERVFETKFREFADIIKKIIQSKRMDLSVNIQFQQRWVINSIKNFKHVLNTPGLLTNMKEVFEDKPVILVAAGPSLEYEIENIKTIKEEGLAFIVTVGSAINTLLYHGIYPDMMTSYDPKETNVFVFRKLINAKIQDIPLVYGSSVGHELLRVYKGGKVHVLTTQDTAANFFLKKNDGKNITGVMDSPSIAVITLQMFAQLNVSQIVLVGQNLAFIGDRDYAGGISYREGGKSKNIGSKQNQMFVKDVYGKDVKTSRIYSTMREELEKFIALFKDTKVVNTTKGGASIKGAPFVELEELIKKELIHKVIDQDWMGQRKKEVPYDLAYLEEQNRVMEKEFEKFKFNLKRIKHILEDMPNLLRNKNYQEIEKNYSKFDKEFNGMNENGYFRTFVQPINRVQVSVLMNKYRDIKVENNKNKKCNKFISATTEFVDNCTSISKEIEKEYWSMRDEIKSFVKSKNRKEASNMKKNYKKPYIIAEIGCNHKGDMKIAKDLVKIAAIYCKADAVKFQKRNNMELLSEEEYNAPHPDKSNAYAGTYGKHREFLEFNLEQHEELKEFCETLGITYSTSVWDMTSAKEIASIHPEFIKIPSAMNTHWEMMEWLYDHYEGDIHISTGMTTKDEIEEIINFSIEKGRNKETILYHCTSGYPVPYEDISLLDINLLKDRYEDNVKAIGFSGHHIGTAPDMAAYTLGAEYIERHYTLDRTWKGTDHAASLEPEDMKKLVDGLNSTFKALTHKREDVLEIEKVQRKKLKYGREKEK